ncbi:hypothetical protein [Dactylosporangium salmoneum]|uniref:Uncharacterized protein n=1 Tax=Dactylosporangium salmoneum TaxID=53361 RepID=A0ABP5U726_9ACTN
MPRPAEPRTITPALLRDWPLPAAPGGDKHGRGTVLFDGVAYTIGTI